MEIIINVHQQNASFNGDFYPRIKISAENPIITIHPIFAEDWKSLCKYIVFSSDCFDYEYYRLENETISVPEKFLKAPGVAIHFIGQETFEEKHNYNLSTNFIIIGVER